MRQLSIMSDPEEYQSRVAAAVMKAIFDSSVIEIDGAPTTYVATAEVMDALVNVMASIVEGSPTCQTSAGIRDMSQAIARKLNVRIREVRRIIAETGHTPFASQIVTTN
jgi:hypothetical protein